MGLVKLHEGEYRRWHPRKWGKAPEDCGNEEWQLLNQTDGGMETYHWIWRHHQLQMTAMTSTRPPDLQSARQQKASGINSTMVRKARGQSLTAAYEARNVFITSLPEVLLLHMDKRTAKELYEEWWECEIIIGRRPQRGVLVSELLSDQPLVHGWQVGSAGEQLKHKLLTVLGGTCWRHVGEVIFRCVWEQKGFKLR